MISCPCHDPHPGLAQQPDPGVSVRWVAHKWGVSSGTPGAGQRPGAPGMRGRGRPDNSPVAPPELLPQPLVFIWAMVHTSWRVRCCVSHGRCSTRRQPLRSCKMRPALFSAAYYPPSALPGPAVQLSLHRTSSVAEQGAPLSERGTSRGEDPEHTQM